MAGTTYTEADETVVNLMQTVMIGHHKGLHDAKVSVGVLMAHAPRDDNDNRIPPAIKLRGFACEAKIRITNLEQRAAGLPDAIMVIDGDEWPTWDDNHQEALLDHELTHLELVMFDGAVRRDDCGRPKLRMRRHDYEVAGFYEVAARHKDDAGEVKQVKSLGKEFVRQGLLPGF